MPKFTILVMPFVLVGILETYAATQIQHPGTSPVNVLSGGTLAGGQYSPSSYRACGAEKAKSLITRSVNRVSG